MGRHVDRLHRIHDALRALGAEITSFNIAPAATEREVDAMERTLRRPIPPALRQLFLDESAAFDIMWSIEGGKGKRAALDFAGSFDLSLAALPLVLFNWSGWRDSFAMPEQHGQPPEWNLTIYDALFPLVTPANGDQLVLARDDDEGPGEVIYLDHEGGDFDKAILSDSFDAFLDVWVPLGCPGPEYWELEAFFDYDRQRLSLDTPAAREWLARLGQA